MNDAPDCLHCGVCCFSDLETYVRVTGEDWTRLGPDADRAAHFIGHRAYLKMVDGHCASLELRPATGEFFCTIYERRPQTCRDLGRCTPECAGELAAKSPRPAAALAHAKAQPSVTPPGHSQALRAALQM